MSDFVFSTDLIFTVNPPEMFIFDVLIYLAKQVPTPDIITTNHNYHLVIVCEISVLVISLVRGLYMMWFYDSFDLLVLSLLHYFIPRGICCVIISV